jgi:hypothetical protein
VRLDYRSDIRFVSDGERSFPESLETEEVFPSRSNLTTYGNPTFRRQMIYAVEKASLQERERERERDSCSCHYDRREAPQLRPR